MKSLNVLYILILASCFCNVTVVWSQTPEQIFQQGLQKEEGEGALEEAIQIYESIIEADNSGRELQAMTILHIGLCYQKLGNNEARNAYQRIINEYGEQREVVAMARNMMSQMQPSATVKESSKGIILKQVWNDPNVEGGGTVSPDGRFISYWDLETGNLGYRDNSTGKTKLLTNEGTYVEPMQFTINSAISPDGKHVAYSWYNPHKTYDLRIIDLDDPEPYILYGNKDEEVYPVSWSSDGEFILARRYSDSVSGEIIEVAYPTGEIRVLKTFEDGYWMRMVYSPERRFVVYDVPVEADQGNFDIAIIAPGNEEELLLVEHPANDRLLGWIPNTNEVLFISDRLGTWDCWIISIVDGTPDTKAQRLFSGIGQIGPLGFTADGTFYYSISSRTHTTSIFPLDQTTFRLESSLAKPFLESIFDIEYSPDGNSLAYVKEFIEPAGPGWYDRPLYMLNIKTGEERRLTRELEVKSPHWSNDGTRILCTGFGRLAEEETDYWGGLYEINVETGKVIEILLFPEMTKGVNYGWVDFRAEWWGDDMGIFYIMGPRIIKRDLQTGEEIILLEQENLGQVLHLSPDANELLYCIESHTEGKGSIMRLPLLGGEPVEIAATQMSESIDEAVWSIDGNYILFSDNTNDKSVIWYVEKEGGSLQNIWQSDDQVSGISLHPDGKNVAISSFFQIAEVWRMENILSYRINGK